MYNNGRPSGEAFVEIENPDDYTEAQKKHNAHLGSRYVEGEYNLIFLCS